MQEPGHPTLAEARQNNNTLHRYFNSKVNAQINAVPCIDVMAEHSHKDQRTVFQGSGDFGAGAKKGKSKARKKRSRPKNVGLRARKQIKICEMSNIWALGVGEVIGDL